MEIMRLHHDLIDVSPSCDSGRCSPVEPVSLSPDSVQRDISSGYMSMTDKNSEYGDDIVYTYINIGDDAFEFTKEPQKKPIKTTNLTLEILERRKANLPYEDLLIKHFTNQSNNDDFLDRPRPPKEVYVIKYSRKQTSKDSPDNPDLSQVHDKEDEKYSSNNNSLGEYGLNGELKALNSDCNNAAIAENLSQDTNLSLDDKSCLKYKRKCHKKALGSDKNNDRNGISSDKSSTLSVSSSSDAIQQPDLSPSIVFKRQLHSKDFSSNEDENSSKCAEDYSSKTKFSVDQPNISPSIQFKRQLHNKEFTSTECSRDDKVVKKYQRKASSKVNQDNNGDSTDFQDNAQDSGSKSEFSLDQPEISQSIKLKRQLQSKAFISSVCNGDEVVKKYHRKLVITNKNEDLSDCKDIPKDYASKSELSVEQPEISQSIKLKRQLQSKAFSSNVCNEGEVVKKYQRKVINKLHQDEDQDLSGFQDVPKACDSKDKFSVDQPEITQSIKFKRQLLRKFISASNSNGGCFDQKFS